MVSQVEILHALVHFCMLIFVQTRIHGEKRKWNVCWRRHMYHICELQMRKRIDAVKCSQMRNDTCCCYEVKWCSRFKWYSNQVENELYICWFSWFRWNASEVASYFYATLCYCKCYQMLSATVSAIKWILMFTSSRFT